MEVVSGRYDPVQLEEKVSLFWDKNRIFQKLVEMKKGGPLFRFLEGPPTANGFMHVGHARGRTMKDVFLRFKTMQGHNVWRQAGWDCHGLPVELEVERKLGIKSKGEIGQKISLPKFITQCQELVDFYIDHWRKASEKLGLWLDYDHAYETRDEDYIEFVWWTLNKAHAMSLLVEDFRVVPTCPRCETSLSSHEVAQGYATVKDPSIFVKFPLKGEKNSFIVIWTTTPWTLPGNEAVCVHPKFDYAKVRVGKEVWILATALVDAVMKEVGVTELEILESIKGKELKGLKYVHPLLEEVSAHEKHKGKLDHSVILGEHVTLEEGTGCVHTAPAHGPEDFDVGKKYGLPVFSPVNLSGHFTDEGGKYVAKYVKEADSIILDDLKKRGLLLKSGIIEHEYPLCWRCDTPLIHRADKQWFLRIDPLKDNILKENEAVDWIPEWAGTSRFRDWIVNAEDWCISRSRIWGTPLNVWVCESCGEKKVVGTVKELESLAKFLPKDLKLHKPWIDRVLLECQKCGGKMNRVDYVLDCWLDSGAAHAAAVNYLKNNLFFNQLYPYEFITEAVDQTRGWFYSLIFTGVMLFNKGPYKRVLCQGLVLDKYGQKMSKSKGNVIWALDAMKRVGVDPLRLYILWKSHPWDSLAFDFDEVDQTKRWLSILWNVFSFSTTYMNLDEFDPKKWTLERLRDSLRPEDRWMLSKINSLIREVTEDIDRLFLHQPVRSMLKFITEDLSRFYVRLARKRTWIEREDPDKLAAYATLYESLLTILKLLAPYAPYLTEDLYQRFVRSIDPKAPESIHMCSWPEVKEAWINEDLENQMEAIRTMLSSVLYARQKAGLKLRWPVRSFTVVPSDEETASTVEKLKNVFLSQANAKTLELLKPGETSKQVKTIVEPNYEKAGPRFKERLPEISKLLRETEGRKVTQELLEKGEYSLRLEDGSVANLTEDLLIFKEELPEHLVRADSPRARIYIDVTRSTEILAESLAKEVVRRAQLMRKELNLRIEEYVDLFLKAQRQETLKAFSDLRDYIAIEIRTRRVTLLDPKQEFDLPKQAYKRTWNIEGEKVEIAIVQT